MSDLRWHLCKNWFGGSIHLQIDANLVTIHIKPSCTVLFPIIANTWTFASYWNFPIVYKWISFDQLLHNGVQRFWFSGPANFDRDETEIETMSHPIIIIPLQKFVFLSTKIIILFHILRFTDTPIGVIKDLLFRPKIFDNTMQYK